ncbi:MAG TPA: hypothetical protein VHL11_03855, partial [Phototrophicaceae bacterium]|nr:hypothetical protein [Phototrophicaceae bacterium]
MRAASLLLILILALSFHSIAAQQATPQPPYRLHHPSAAEYLTTLAEIIPIAEATELDDESAVSDVIYEEFWSRYPDLNDLSDVPFEVLAQVNLFYLIHTYANFFEGIDNPRTLPGLYNMMLQSWLREYHSDLSAQDVWHLNDDYILEIQSVDLNGDGVDEVIAAYHD